MSEDKKVVISIRLPERLLEIIKKNAQQEDRSVGAEIRRTLERYTKA